MPVLHDIILVPMVRLARWLAIPALLLSITIGFFWKLALTDQYTYVDSPDLFAQVMPWLQMETVEWQAKRFPLWDPHVWAGQPVVGQVQPGALNPLNWILFSIPLSNGFIQLATLHWYWVAIHFLGVLFAYWLCRDLGFSRAASILGGCAYGLGGFLGTIGWPQQAMSALLLPLVLMFFLRVVRGEKVIGNAAASGAMLGLSFLSGHHNVPVFSLVAMIALWIYYLAVVRRTLRWSAIAPLAAFLACFAFIASAQILPAQELGKLSVRWVGSPNDPLTLDQTVPYVVHDQFSLKPAALLGIIMPGYQNGSPVFIGLVAIVLALIGLVERWEERMVRVAGAMALAGLLLALGANSIFHGLLYAILPGIDKIRSPSYAVAIFHAGVAVLAACGVDSLARSQAAVSRVTARVLGAVAFVLFSTVLLLANMRPEKGEEYKFLIQGAFVCVLLAALLAAWTRARISNTAASVLAILLLLFELNPVVTYGFHPRTAMTYLPKLSQHVDIANFLKQREGLSRVELDDKEISYNFGDWFGIDQIDGYLAGVQKSILDAQGDPRFRSLLAINYFIGRNPIRPDQTPVFEGQSGVKVFLNPSALPRARIVHTAIGVADENAVKATVDNPATDLQRTVVLAGSAPSLENCEGGSVDVLHYHPARVILHANTPCRAMLVFADTWYPGWKATVDGKSAPIYAAYNVIRGVVVDGGQHEVVLRYRPVSVFAGAALAILGIALAIALQFPLPKFRHRPETRRHFWHHS